VQRDTKQRHTHTHHPLLHRQMCTAISAAPTTFSSLSVYPSIAQREREREKESERERERERERECVHAWPPMLCGTRNLFLNCPRTSTRALFLSSLVDSTVAAPHSPTTTAAHTSHTRVLSLLSLSLSERDKERRTGLCVLRKRERPRHKGLGGNQIPMTRRTKARTFRVGRRIQPAKKTSCNI
jgi:hypothetical protein